MELVRLLAELANASTLYTDRVNDMIFIHHTKNSMPCSLQGVGSFTGLGGIEGF